MSSSMANSFCCDPSSFTALATGPDSGSLAMSSSPGSPSPPSSASAQSESFSAGGLRSVGSTQSQPPSSHNAREARRPARANPRARPRPASPRRRGGRFRRSLIPAADQWTSRAHENRRRPGPRRRRRLRVVLADDHVVVRQGLKGLLEREGFAVGAEASNALEAIRLTRHFRPDVAVLDFDMPLMNGIDAVREILRHSLRTRTILLTADTGHQHLPEALRAGVRGFVLKNHAVAHLVRAIREVTRGGVYVSPSVATTVARVSLAKTDVPLDRLTRRERQVLQLIAEGKKTKEIAALLGVKFK